MLKISSIWSICLLGLFIRNSFFSKNTDKTIEFKRFSEVHHQPSKSIDYRAEAFKVNDLRKILQKVGKSFWSMCGFKAFYIAKMAAKYFYFALLSKRS